jgi:hypothetical protein
MSVDIIPFSQVVYISRKEMLFLDVSWVNFIVGIVGMVKETIEKHGLGNWHII